ncbi:DUF1217 domain-containing protein [Phaeobacter sp. 22II1-1F12B]|uniref:DUF1217 domain-containing protein n=1 Tax=Phaeobacter sp. 22II1-1F12B TaxID=1317111 RepID=UPI000B526D46|nr:DUF1217 domain-containing protein [Phaeobacter sp. 22II1-1F12B]OWU78137.1 hypothetical protein ATO1_14135 [Phaeobacter sp. 22II1-1F12B]
MIPISASSSLLGLKIADATKDTQIETIKNTAQHGRAIETFLERIGDVETVDQLVDDYELYTFVMKAFDLEDQIFGKAMIKSILKSDIDDDESLINKLTDSRFKELYEGMGFDNGGTTNINTLLPSWQNDMVERYTDTIFVNNQAEQNETVAAALEFRAKAAEVENPFDILKDKEMASFMRTVLGFPDEMAQVDIDRQAKFIEEAYDLTKLQDPEEVEKLIKRFTIISDAKDGSNVANNPIVQMMSGATSIGSGSFVPITLDISTIDFASLKAYR